MPTEQMARLVPEDKRHLVSSLLPRREPFQVLYRINCDNLCSDFQVGSVAAPQTTRTQTHC